LPNISAKIVPGHIQTALTL